MNLAYEDGANISYHFDTVSDNAYNWSCRTFGCNAHVGIEKNK
jgi:hypothetical protein